MTQTSLTTVNVTWLYYDTNSEQNNTVGFMIYYQSESDEGIVRTGYVCRDYDTSTEICEYLLEDLNNTFTYDISVVGISDDLPGQPSSPVSVTLGKKTVA